MSQPSRGAANLPIFAAGGAVAAALLGDSMLYAVMPSNPGAWGLSAGIMIGVLLSANRIVRLASNPLAAMVFNRFGSRAPFAAAMAVAVVVTATYGWTAAFWLLLLARIAWGVCWSVLRLGGFWAVLDGATDENRGLLMGTYSSVARLGGIVGAIAGGTLTDAVGHRSTLTLFAALTAVGGVAWYLATRSTARQSRPLMAARGETGGLAAVLGDRRLLAVSAGGLVTGLVFAGLVSASLGFYLRAQYGEEVPVAGAAIGVASLTGVMLGMRSLLNLPVAPLAGHISDRLGRTRVTLAAYALGAAGLVVLATAGAIAQVAAGVFLTFVAATALNTLLLAAAGDMAPPERRSAVMSTYATFLDLGAALGPLVGLSTGSLLALRGTFLAAAVMLVVMGLWHRVVFARDADRPVEAPPSAATFEGRR